MATARPCTSNVVGHPGRSSRTSGRRRGFSPEATILSAIALLATSCTTTPNASLANDWQPLSNTHTTAGWHNVAKPTLDPRWQAIDGVLVLTEAGGGDIISEHSYADFEFEVDWQVDAGGNSGLFYRAVDAEPIWHRAVEFQLLDDRAAEDRFDPSHRAGAVYDLVAPQNAVLRPQGQYNHARIVACGPRVEHWLNGVQVAAYDLDSRDWQQRVAASKFADQPDFARARSGHIGFQDHGNGVRLKDLRLRTLTTCR